MRPSKFYAVTVFLLAAFALLYLFGFGSSPVIFEIRFSKFICAVLCGAALGSAGVMLQNLLQNSLADPYILGTSSGGAAGAVLAQILGFSFFGPMFYLFIICGAFFISLLVCSLSYIGGKSSSAKIILAGVAVNIFLASLISLVLLLRHTDYLSMLSFMLGSISERPLFAVVSSGIIIFCGFILALLFARQSDIAALGPERASALGADTKLLNYGILASVSLLASGSVALCGLIGFVGFIVPHICRIFLGPKAKTLIFAGALAGATFLVGAEVLNRLIFYPFQMPEGVLCSLCGAPFFLWVLLKGKGRDYDA